MTDTTCIEAPGRSLDDAILEDLVDSGSGCTLMELEYLEEEFGTDIWDAVFALIFARRAYVTEPLKRVDWDTTVFPVTWEVGRSTVADIENCFRQAGAVVETGEGRVLTVDLYLEIVEPGYPRPPKPYAVRDAEDESRPEGCNFPYTGVWPPEALQVEFVFDAAGLLARYDFKVGERVS